MHKPLITAHLLGVVLVLAVLSIFLGARAEASIVYTLRSNCLSWTVWTDGDPTEMKCPGAFTGRVVMPDSYVPGTTLVSGPWSTQSQGYVEIDHFYWGDRMPFDLVSSEEWRWAITLPVHAGPGLFEHSGQTWSFIQDQPNRWHWVNELNTGLWSLYVGGPLIFKRVPEPGTFALLALGLLGLGWRKPQ